MSETLRTKKIFELYYSMSNRSLVKLEKLLSQKYSDNIPKLITLKSWSKKYNWQKRIELRDIENGKEIEKQTNKSIIEIRADYRKEIKEQIGIYKSMLDQVLKDIKNEKYIKPTSTKELKDITNSYDKLIRLDLTMMGDNPDGKNIDINIEYTDEEDHRKQINNLSIEKLNKIRETLESD